MYAAVLCKFLSTTETPLARNTLLAYCGHPQVGGFCERASSDPVWGDGKVGSGQTLLGKMYEQLLSAGRMPTDAQATRCLYVHWPTHQEFKTSASAFFEYPEQHGSNEP